MIDKKLVKSGTVLRKWAKVVQKKLQKKNKNW